MAQHVEPMDIDSTVCDFDDKENAFHHNNALPRTPCTEKGYEELDVSELNMKLRYSVTPAASPMSKSYTGNCFDNRNYETDNMLDGENGNMTRSLHTTLTKSDTIIKAPKTLPLQSLPTDLPQISDGNRNILQPLDSTVTVDNNITVTISGANDIDENLSLPSLSSSTTHTPEATTPTKEIPKGDGGSPIIRGLKSVLNMFRASQSPILGEEDMAKLETLSPPIVHSPETSRDDKNDAVSASTPLVTHKPKDPLTKINSPNRESIVFNEDFEKELEWKDDSTIIFSNEKIPIHKLFFQHPTSSDSKRTLDLSKVEINELKNKDEGQNLNETVEYMDISYNDSGIMDKTATITKIISDLNKSEVVYTESDSEFVDCESTFTKNDSFKSQNDSFKLPIDSEFNSTEDVLSHINDLVETKNDYALRETLNVSDPKSINLSTASTETTKHNDSLVTIANSTLENIQEDLLQEIQTEDEAKDAILAVSDKIEIDPNSHVNELVSDKVTSNSNIQNNETIVVNSPVVENKGVKSLSQIPLIADPRILLFNISPFEDDNENKIIKDVSLEIPPADIPLPEDDDIPSLPVMNSELENLSHTLDKIAEEIPKINQHESSVSSVGSLSDNKSIESPISESVISHEFGETMAQITSSENTQNVHTEPEVENEVKREENSEFHETISAINPPSEIKVEFEYTALPASLSENTNVLVSSTGIQSLTDNIILPSEICENYNMPIPDITEIKTIDENIAVLPTTNPDNIDIPISISGKPSTEMVQKVVIQKNNVSESALVHTDRQPELYNVVPVAQSIIQKEIEVQVVEPMDVSITDTQVTTEIQKRHSENVANVISSIIELGATQEQQEDVVNAKENEVDSNIQSETPIKSIQVNFAIPDTEFSSKIVETSNDTSEKYYAHMIESNIDIIKQEVDAIVTRAIDIAIEKSEGKINDKSENTNVNTTLADTSVNIEKETITGLEQELIKPKNDSSKDPESTNALFETDVMSFEEEADIQQKSLNRLSANKYSYTVQDNIPSTVTNDNNAPADIISDVALNNQTFCATETPNISAGATKDNNLTKNNNMKLIQYVEEIINKDKTLDVTPPDMVKVEPVATTDEEIIVSENNSPFVSVSHVLEEAVEVKPIENTFATNSNVITPPASPKIVSKGYNFNFDEIDDPFATKTKIRVSPALDAVQNQTVEQINVDQEPPKKEVIKNYRRRSQPDRKRPAVNNKKINATFSGKSSIHAKPTASVVKAVSPQGSEIIETAFELEPSGLKDLPKDFSESQDVTRTVLTDTRIETEENKLPIKSAPILKNEIKENSSLEQSIYFSAGTSSDEVIKTTSGFKTPDFDDPNLNPFASKSKIRQSPPSENFSNPFTNKSRICQTPPLETEDPFATTSKIKTSGETSLVNSEGEEMLSNFSNTYTTETPINMNEDTIKYSGAINTADIELEKEVRSNENDNIKLDLPEEKESTENISGTTCSSNNDKEITIRDVNTEDEDTVEGPFLEADDLHNYDKMSDFDGENADMMQFSELPPENQENPDGGELFIDAEAFEFLLNQNIANTVTDSGKESLFLKFDPLFAKRLSSDGVMAALKHSQTQVKQSTPIKDKKPPIPRDITFDKSSPLAGPSGTDTTQEIDLNSTTEESYEDLNVTVSKPMMVVNPAVNPVVTPRNKTMTPVRSNRQSLTFTSPAIAVIDRLLSMSAANNSLMAHDTTVAEVPRDNEADLALTQLRELLADKEISVYNLRSETKELQNRLATLESQMKNLENISEERLKKINVLNEKLNEKSLINKKMAKVVEEYERTIASLIDETEQDKKRHAEERLQLIKERDEQTAHLASMEVSFSDLHSKYEKSKQIIIAFKTNEDTYKKSIKEFEENLAKMQKNYELLKQHATSKLNHANEELQKINRAHESEVLKMNAMIKRKELHITSLEETLQQKTKANEELTAICDELINKVG